MDIIKRFPIEYCVKVINEMGDMMNRITTWDYETYGYNCLLFNKEEASKTIQEAKESRVLSTQEIKDFFNRRLIEIKRDTTDEKLKRAGISEKDFQEKYHEFESVINFLSEETDKVYEVVNTYYRWLIYIKDKIVFFSILSQVHLD
jgi:Zn-finger domain-containing protein